MNIEEESVGGWYKKGFWILVGVVIFVLFLLFVLFSSDDNPIIDDSSLFTPNNTFVDDSETSSNITLLHFSNMPVTYRYSSLCVGPIVPRIEWAFEILENKTDGLLTFKQVSSEADIDFICSPESNTRAVGDYATEAVYGESSIESTSGSIIEKARIKFWSVREDTRPPSCFTFPSLELHEIMHTFGFAHHDYNRYSLMFPDAWQECVGKNQTITLHSTGETFMPEDKIDDEIVSCLKFIYSNGTQESCNGVYRDESDCPIEWYPDKYDESCCPEPNMFINDEGNCAYEI